MPEPPKRIALVGKGNIPHVRAEAKKVHAFLESHGVEVRYESNLAQGLMEPAYALLELDAWADVFVTVGGDGTILFTQQTTMKPVFGINAGAIGFLAEVEPPQAEAGLLRVLAGDYIIEERARLACWLEGERLQDAVNEVTLQTSRIAKLIRFRVFVDGHILDTFRGDGVILATATGSTGYAMSVGGPLVCPTVGGMVLAPIAPFKLASRPWVLPDKSEVVIELLERDSAQGLQQAKVVIDGQHPYDVATGAKITLRKSNRPARYVRLGDGFYERVRTKLTR